MSVAVITASSRRPHEPYYFLPQFEESCRRKNIVPHFLNEGPWLGLMTKPKHLKIYLEREGARFSHCIMVDSWDIIFASGVDEIMSTYKASYRGPIVFNCEKSCFPLAELADHHPESPTPYRFLNSGFMLGETGAILDMLRDMKLETIPDDKLPDGTIVNTNDQSEIMRWYVRNKDKVELDNRARLCQSLHLSGPDEFSFDSGLNRVMSNLTHEYPCVFHGNGGGKAWLQTIMRWMKLI